MQLAASPTTTCLRSYGKGVSVESLNNENKQFLLDILNHWWTDATVPQDILLARVVPIYKKGDIDNPSNYRPISLLNAMYKIYVSLARARVQKAVEFKVSPTQYGFRPNRSTAHATYLIRRLQDWSEQKKRTVLSGIDRLGESI